MRNSVILLLAVLITSASCRKKDDAQPLPPDTGGTAGCQTSYDPIVMCHGFLASGDTYAGQVKRFVQNGQCGDRIFVHDRNTLGGGSAVALLDAFIDQVLQQTGAQRVELVGHSAGGGLGYDYLADPVRAAKVGHYVHIGSGVQPGPAGPGGSVPTLNIWSPDDAIASSGDITGATNVSLAGQDHYEVATSAEAFEAMYTFFRGSAPASSIIQADGARTVAGKVLTLGENQPIANAPVRVFEVDAASGFRFSSDPVHSFTSDASGNWGSFAATPGMYYEFEVSPPGGRRLHYYREPFITSDRLVYLRTMPPASSLAGALLASLPSNDDQAVLTVFTANQAVLTGRDELVADGLLLSTPEFASASTTAIAFFLYDNGDGQTNGTPVGLFGSFPFLSGVDMFFPTTQPESIPVSFNGRVMNVRNWPSQSEGITVVVFE